MAEFLYGPLALPYQYQQPIATAADYPYGHAAYAAYQEPTAASANTQSVPNLHQRKAKKKNNVKTDRASVIKTTFRKL